MIDRSKLVERELTEEEEMYKENVLDHYKNPHNFGSLESYDCKHRDLNPLCGDEVEVTVRLDGEVVREIKFKGHGCAISTASASLLTDHVKGKKVEEIMKMGKEDVDELLGIPISITRRKCAMLALNVIKSCLGGSQ